MLLTINSGTLTKSHSTDAGFDIHSAETTIILPLSSASIYTNLKISLPQNTIALVKPRSGLSFKYSIETGAGVIDQDYTGEIKVHLYNFGTEPYKVSTDDKIAQLLILPIVHPEVIATKDATYNSPSDSTRGDNGFGSTDE